MNTIKALLALALAMYTAVCCPGCSTKQGEESTLEANAEESLDGSVPLPQEKAGQNKEGSGAQGSADTSPPTPADTPASASPDAEDKADYGPCPADYRAALRAQAKVALQGKYLSTGRDIAIMVDTLPLEKKRLNEEIFGWKGNLIVCYWNTTLKETDFDIYEFYLREGHKPFFHSLNRLLEAEDLPPSTPEMQAEAASTAVNEVVDLFGKYYLYVLSLGLSGEISESLVPKLFMSSGIIGRATRGYTLDKIEEQRKRQGCSLVRVKMY